MIDKGTHSVLRCRRIKREIVSKRCMADRLRIRADSLQRMLSVVGCRLPEFCYQFQYVVIHQLHNSINNKTAREISRAVYNFL